MQMGCDSKDWSGKPIIGTINIWSDIACKSIKITAFEDFVAEQVKVGAAVIGLYPATSESRGRLRRLTGEERPLGHAYHQYH